MSLSPNYLKALNRRAHLYEKLEKWDECLLDVTACCIFEKFKNADNIVCMDQILKKIGQQKAQEERAKLLHELPSASFIRNYLSAFACNPFVAINPQVCKKSSRSESTTNGTTATDEHVSSDSSIIINDNNLYDPLNYKEPVQSALKTLNASLDYMSKGEYAQSAEYVMKAVSLFESVSCVNVYFIIITTCYSFQVEYIWPQ
ncbi:unnamed protein product [Trichobilharzia regenti]|nr:unnamed protein product [Trichobilharzia regenti]